MLKNSLYVYGEQNLLTIPMHINFGQYMLHRITRYDDSVALINASTEETLTYRELAQKTVDVALSLTRIGVRKGDVIAICSEDHMDYISTVLGTMCAGGVHMPTDLSGTATIFHSLKVVEPKIMFCSSAMFKAHKETFQSIGSIKIYILYGNEAIRGTTLFRDFVTQHGDVENFLAVPVKGCEDYALLMRSAGTTGLPKIIPNTHYNLINSYWNMILRNQHKRVLQTYRWSTIYSLTYSLGCLHGGATVVYMMQHTLQNELYTVQRFQIKEMNYVPYIILEMMSSDLVNKYDLSSLETIISTGSVLEADQERSFRRKFPKIRICQCYSTTDAGGICATIPIDTLKPGSVGQVLPGVTVKIVDLDTRLPVGENKRGEICVKSPGLTTGYLGSEVLVLDQEGFFRTGDMGYYDREHYFYIVDRIRDIITYKGNAVSPTELETVLQTHPAVLEAGVAGKPHPRYEQLPTAFVVLRSGAAVNEEALQEFVNEQVAVELELAGGVRFVSKLPRGRDGMLDRKALKGML